MATDEHLLLLQVSADVSKLEKQFAKATGIVAAGSAAMEARAGHAATRLTQSFSGSGVGKALDNIFDRSRLAVIESGTAKIPVFGSVIADLGPAGFAGAAGVGALMGAMALATNAVDWAETLQRSADSIGETTTRLQEFDFVAAGSDVPIAAMRTGLERLNEVMGRVQDGLMRGKNNVETRAFGALGITKADLATYQSAAQLLPVIADRIREVRTAAEQSAIAKAMGIAELLPLLKRGGDYIREMTQRAHQLGAVVDGETVGAVNHLAEASHEADLRLGAAAHTIGAEMVPMLVAMKNAAAGAIDALARLIALYPQTRSAQMGQLMSTYWGEENRAANLRAGRFDLAAPGGNIAITAGERAQSVRDAEAAAASTLAQIRTLQAQIEAARQADAAATAAANAPSGALADLADASVRGRHGHHGRAAHAHMLRASLPHEAQTSFGRWYGQHPFQSEADASAAWWTEQGAGRVSALGSGAPAMAPGLAPMTAVAGQLLDPQQLAAQTQALQQRLTDMFRGALEAGMHGGWPGVLRYFETSMEESFIKSLTSGIATSLAGWINGQGTQNPSASAGKTLLGFIGGVGHLLGFADGTLSAPGGLAMVGERGPELVNLPKGAQVIPNRALSGLAVTPGMSVTSVSNHFDLRGAVTTADLVGQMNQISQKNAHQAAAAYSLAAAQGVRRQVQMDNARRASMALR